MAVAGRGGTASTPGAFGGASGRILRTARESLALSQESLAEKLEVDINTLKAWETGRRPLANVKASVLRRLIRRLRVLGSDSVILSQLDVAMDVDSVIGELLEESPIGPVESHPLASWVTTREWNRLITHTIAGPNRVVGESDRLIICSRLRCLAEQTLGAADDERALRLRRQILYILPSIDPNAGDWIAKMGGVTARALRQLHDWSPIWVAGRSSAIARAASGDRDPLRHFLEAHLRADPLEAANLNYWAYWLGDDYPGHEAVSDSFMARGLGLWQGHTLLRHLTVGLDPKVAHVELSIHSLWALLQRRPSLIEPTLARELAERSAKLLDISDPSLLSPPARREVDQLHYAARISATKGTA
jgi:transcriptional regulator with XRE-family HTH domain